ncbi:hypothetical protein [Caballeronia arationis]|uniref:hypothetical protein n=1 Tax=Caballeronia arationis TaxID=1777142 RepID=UPI0011982145|nr:hypothetical protein [Caballeronia arationis]
MRSTLLRMKLTDRFSYDADKNLLSINFEGHDVSTTGDVKAIREEVERPLGSIMTRPYTMANYDNFTIRPEVLDEYSAMVSALVARFCTGVTRYTTSSFLRMKRRRTEGKWRRSVHIRKLGGGKGAHVCGPIRRDIALKPTFSDPSQLVTSVRVGRRHSF